MLCLKTNLYQPSRWIKNWNDVKILIVGGSLTRNMEDIL